MEWHYVLLHSTYPNGSDIQKSFGIAAVEETDGIVITLESYNDLSSDKHSVEQLVKSCNDNQLSPVHLYDVIQDFLAAI